ncbi:MAG: DUF1648 domain-containing protein [Andreesenia angusta]|nr:DUF1648 domain-containing protein [Andreesenia angusta]
MLERIKDKYKSNKLVYIKWIIAVLPLLFLIIIFHRIPAQIPVQYSDDGKIISYASKYSIDMLLQASLGIISAIIITFGLKFILSINFKPEQDNYLRIVKIMEYMGIVITAAFSLFSFMILVKYI